MAIKRLRHVRVVSVLPTLMTLGNGVCGFAAITLTAKVTPDIGVESLVFTAGMLLFFAMLFDVLDGGVARLTNQTSDFGAQLDSLCDAISFGVAPALLMMKLSDVYHPRVLWVIGVLYMICVILRLARFNVETEDEDSHELFSGLPSPAAAGTIAAIAISIPALQNLVAPEMSDTTRAIGKAALTFVRVGLPLVVLALCGLMVSRFRYPHVMNQWVRGRQSFQHLVMLVFAIVAVVAVHELAVPMAFLYFAFASPLRAAWREITGRRKREMAAEVSN